MMPDGATEEAADGGRCHDLDWLRVFAFGLLILYHAGLNYSTDAWLVANTHDSRVVDMLLLATHPWRMCILFLVSGAATACMSATRHPARLLGERTMRLMPPFFFGVLVVVPPQVYYVVRGHLGLDVDFWTFWTEHYLTAHTLTAGGRTYLLVNVLHLWFIGYLWLYTAVLLVLAQARWIRSAIRAFGERHLAGPGILMWPVLFFFLTRHLAFPVFGEQTGLSRDWYNHLDFFASFAFGFLFARSAPVWGACVAYRHLALALALLGWVALAALSWQYGADLGTSDLLDVTLRIAHSIERWCAVAAALGFARRHLDRDCRAIRYLTGGIFTYYVLHQTFMVSVAHHLAPLAMPAALEAAILIVATLASCALSYEFIRRMPLLRPFFGMKLRPAASEPAFRVRRGLAPAVGSASA